MATVEDIENEILDAIQGYRTTLNRELAVLVSNITAELKAGGFKDQTGNLRRSMRAYLIDKSLTIEMLYYGFFQSFGVNGTKKQFGVGITEEVGEAFTKQGYPGLKGKYTYKTGYVFGTASNPVKVAGIKPKNFYPTDVEDRLIKIIEKFN